MKFIFLNNGVAETTECCTSSSHAISSITANCVYMFNGSEVVLTVQQVSAGKVHSLTAIVLTSSTAHL